MRGLWETTTVEALVERGALARPMDGNHGSIHPKTIDFVDAGIPFVMASDLENGRVDLRSCAFLAEDQARSLKKGFSFEGDVLLTHKATIGRTAIVPKIPYPFIMLTPQVTYYRVLDEKVINNQFLKLYFESKPFADILNSWAGSGSTRAYIGITEQKKLPIMLPPIGEQVEIVRVIKPIDDKIELNRRMNETLEAMAQAIFRDWFVDFGPVRRKMAGATDPVEIMGGVTLDPVRATELATLFPTEIGDDELPMGWVSQQLNELATLAKSTINPLAFPDEAFEHYSLPAYDNGQEPALDLGEMIKSNKTIVPAGSVLLSKLNPDISRVWLPNTAKDLRQLASTEFLAFAPKQGASRGLLYFLFKDPTVRQTLESMVTGTSKSHQRISPPALLTTTLLAASTPCAAAFGAIVEPILERSLALREENRTLAETRDYLLPRLMSGEVRVGEAAKEIAA